MLPVVNSNSRPSCSDEKSYQEKLLPKICPWSGLHRSWVSDGNKSNSQMWKNLWDRGKCLGNKDRGGLFTEYHSKFVNEFDNVIILLYLRDVDSNFNSIGHFVLITDLPRLILQQIKLWQATKNSARSLVFKLWNCRVQWIRWLVKHIIFSDLIWNQ